MPQDPSLNRSDTMPTQSVQYTAPCPCCGLDAEWRAMSTQTVDLSVTLLGFDVKCPSEVAA